MRKPRQPRLDQERLKPALEQRLKFYDGQGERMSTTEGLKLVREMRQARTRAAG